jgi:hypothetical protein
MAHGPGGLFLKKLMRTFFSIFAHDFGFTLFTVIKNRNFHEYRTATVACIGLAMGL